MLQDFQSVSNHFGTLCFKQLKIIWNVQTIQVEAQSNISACLTVPSRLSIDLQCKGSALHCKILETVIDLSKGFYFIISRYDREGDVTHISFWDFCLYELIKLFIHVHNNLKPKRVSDSNINYFETVKFKREEKQKLKISGFFSCFQVFDNCKFRNRF